MIAVKSGRVDERTQKTGESKVKDCGGGRGTHKPPLGTVRWTIR